MTKTEYIAAIGADLTAANALCAELRTLRNFKKIAKTIPDADKMVAFDVMDKAITSKEGELQKLRSALGKNRRIVKKLEEIEAGKAHAPKSTKDPAEKKASDAKAGKSTGKKTGAGTKAAQGKKNDSAPEQAKAEKPAA